MIAEILGGYAFNSMALLADGWHMGTHTIAIGITVLAYAYAEKKANAPAFIFGTWKVEILGAYTGALLLAVIGLTMGYESIERLFNPKVIKYEYAIATAIIGLLVNGVSAFILRHHSHGHSHGHDHHKPPLESDLNLKVAYAHVITDAITSLLAIIALLVGLAFGWNWMDPLMGIVGSILVLLWSRSLIKQTTSILIDHSVDDEPIKKLRAKVRNIANAAGDVQDLRLWKISNNQYACVIKILGNTQDTIRVRIEDELSTLPITYSAIDIKPAKENQSESKIFK